MRRASLQWSLLLGIALACLCAGACGKHNDASSAAMRAQVDSLNTLAYDWHYRNVDSVRAWSMRAMALADSCGYDEGLAEAMNNLAFERFHQMDFDSAQAITAAVSRTTDDAVELLVADVMQMKVVQRTSDNLAFFRHRSHALQRIAKLEPREKRMTSRRRHRFNYACGDLHIAASTYFYYLDQQERAIAEIRAAEPYCHVPEDTAQWLYYSYMRGSGGLSEQTDAAAIAREEFDYLLPCFWLARRSGFLFFEANAEQSLATFFADSLRLEAVRSTQPEVVMMLTQLFGTDNTPMAMAQAAYDHFVDYDDLYQQACALRTLGELSFEDGRYSDAIRHYAQALACVNFHHQSYYAPNGVQTASTADLLQTYNPLPESESVERNWMLSPDVRTVPEWIAGIRQQLSVAYSALDMKDESDYNRNIYLDLLDVTREDAELESRAAELRNESLRLRWTWAAVVVVALLIVAFILYLLRSWRRRTQTQNRLLRQKMQQIRDAALQQQAELEEEQEQLREQQAATELRLLRDKQQNIEKRAKLQLVNGIQPFLNRIIHEVERMQQRGETSLSSLTYISELTNRINEYNGILTEWIQMQQGQLSLQLTSFPLEPLFDAIRHSRFAYEQKGLTLNVATTDLSVKADRALTLFMLNTLADNARKFTPEGGTVSITAVCGENEDGRYVELAVQDTGCGITEADVQLILNNKVYDATKISTSSDDRKGFGFGLMNCKGIIEKYRKTSPLFSVCRFGIESRVGEGSRFWFRLPRVMTVVLAMLMAFVIQPSSVFAASFPKEAYALADSAYYCNIEGCYEETLQYAERAFALMGEGRDSLDYSLVLGLHNEVAVAALALHDWPLYRNSNRLYTKLFKLTNRDTTLEAYCLQTERSQQTERWALNLLVILILLGILAFYLFYLRPQTAFRRKLAELNDERLAQLQRIKDAEHERRQNDFELAEDEHRRRLYEESRLHVQNQIIDNCLSTIKHETMYYPGRIQQLVERLQEAAPADDGSVDSFPLLSTLAETVSYYSEIHGLLSAQASSQSEALNFRRRRQTFAELTSSLPQHVAAVAQRLGLQTTLTLDDASADALVMGDPDLITYLLTELLDYEIKLSSAKDVALTLSATRDDRFLRFTLINPTVALTDAELHDFFMPHEGAIPTLICKQIIREHDTFLGHPGCRINAERVGEGHAVWFTLPLYINH